MKTKGTTKSVKSADRLYCWRRGCEGGITEREGANEHAREREGRDSRECVIKAGKKKKKTQAQLP